MGTFAEYTAKITNPEHKARVEEVLNWVMTKYPKLGTRIAWNQPMFTDHGTFILGFSTAKKHLSVAPERAAINHFSDEIEAAGFEHSKELIRIPWDGPVPYTLLAHIIDFNISEKVDCKTFWRK